MIVVWEGMDASGKDVLRACFERMTEFGHTCVVRLHLSDLVYARYFGRPRWTDRTVREKFIVGARKFIEVMQPLYVYVTASNQTLARRIENRGESLRDQPRMDTVREYFEDSIRIFGLEHSSNFVRVQTDIGLTLTGACRIVERAVRDLETATRD